MRIYIYIHTDDTAIEEVKGLPRLLCERFPHQMRSCGAAYGVLSGAYFFLPGECIITSGESTSAAHVGGLVGVQSRYLRVDDLLQCWCRLCFRSRRKKYE